MNIVAFILGIFLIFAISTNTFFKNNQNSKIIEKSYIGYMHASRKACNKEENYFFNSLKSIKDDPSSKEDDDEDEDQKIVNNTNVNTSKDNKPKIRIIKPERAKLNIEPLFRDKENNKELYTIFAKLLRVLYSSQNFYKKNFEYELIDNMLFAYEAGIKKSKEMNLINLNMRDDMQIIYYKILKGTKFYDFEKSLGRASLLDFIDFDKNQKKIPLIDASKEVLISVFNEKIAKEIVILQKEDPPKNLTKDNLFYLCKKYDFELDEKTLSMFDFSHIEKTAGNTVFGIDNDTKIKITRNIK